jgi:hypothetical protein
MVKIAQSAEKQAMRPPTVAASFRALDIDPNVF